MEERNSVKTRWVGLTSPSSESDDDEELLELVTSLVDEEPVEAVDAADVELVAEDDELELRRRFLDAACFLPFTCESTKKNRGAFRSSFVSSLFFFCQVPRLALGFPYWVLERVATRIQFREVLLGFNTFSLVSLGFTGFEKENKMAAGPAFVPAPPVWPVRAAASRAGVPAPASRPPVPVAGPSPFRRRGSWPTWTPRILDHGIERDRVFGRNKNERNLDLDEAPAVLERAAADSRRFWLRLRLRFFSALVVDDELASACEGIYVRQNGNWEVKERRQVESEGHHGFAVVGGQKFALAAVRARALVRPLLAVGGLV